MAIGSRGGLPKLIVRLIEQIFGVLGMTAHVPFIGLLGLDHLLPGIVAHSLGRREMWMTVAGNVPRGCLGDGDSNGDKAEQDYKRDDAKSVIGHARNYMADARASTRPAQKFSSSRSRTAEHR